MCLNEVMLIKLEIDGHKYLELLKHVEYFLMCELVILKLAPFWVSQIRSGIYLKHIVYFTEILIKFWI